MTRIAPLHVICMTLLMLIAGSNATAQLAARPDLANTIAKARESAWNAINSGKGSGVSVAIMERGEFVYSEAMGAADRGRNRTVDRDTRFNVGSVSKMFAAVAILMLVDEGKVELDAPVMRYIPELTMADPRYREITVRMLLNHSSGLPGSSFYFGFAPDASTHAVLLETLKRSTLKHAPGAMSMYCNDGFTLAEIVVERMSGRTFMAFLSERIFVPLGMAHTGPTVGESGGDNVAEYYDASSGRKYPREVVSVHATGGLASTAEDLCRFGNSLVPGGTTLLSPASLAEILRPQPTPFATTLIDSQQFGEFGWDYSKRISGTGNTWRVLAKGGNSGFYSANLQILPEERLVIALISSGRASGDKLTQPILAGLLQDRTRDATSPVTRPPEPQPVPAVLARYNGYYAIEAGVLKVFIDKARNKLVLTKMGGSAPPVEMIYSDGYFYGPHADTRYYLRTVGGTDFVVANIVALTGYDTLVGQKLESLRGQRTLAAPMQDEAWLIRNVPASVEVFETSQPIVMSRTYKELPGYVDFEGVRKIQRTDFASIAATAFRDQSDIALVPVDGRLWMRYANVLRSPAREAPRLPPGETSMSIGAAGYNEWRAIDKPATLRFALPDGRGRVMVAAPNRVLHDSLVDGNEAYAPAGSYVFFAGAPGDTLRISEIPSL